MSSQSHIKYATAILVISIHIVTSVPAKSRPVIEVVNEQARIDDKRPQGFIPYANPLAGNSKHNARLHAQAQQAMFNAERIRQHRAQLQRWTKAPQQEDSYMKAYHESQENHQLALEQQQAALNEAKPVTVAPRPRQAAPNKGAPKRDDAKPITISPKLRQLAPIKRAPKRVEAIKITKADAINPEIIRNIDSSIRNHRSYGSMYHQYLQPKKYQSVFVSPGPTYDQGVTIKPNGNIGLASLKTQSSEEAKLYTAAVPSKTQYVYPKHYGQMQNYESAYDIDTLNTLLKKNPTEQLTELNALLKHQVEPTKDTLTTPIDLYFYLKDNPDSLIEQYEHMKHGSPNYASAYTHEIKDHIPITEDVQDIEDPHKHMPKPYTVHATAAPEVEYNVETTTSKTNNYYKVEVASETISAPYNPKASYYYKEETKPSYELSQYHHPYHSYHKENQLDGDHSERYLHHNAQPIGIQHLTEDGAGVSAYGDENLHYAAKYEFGYRVKDYHTGNDFGLHEAKSGENTNGHYHVLLPDGRMQKVKYSAGPEGFHADISYDHLH